jgi:aryl-alcohol dehydrogenase-like predicted oxidoreductase
MSRRNFLTTMLATAGSLIGCATLKQETSDQKILLAATTQPGGAMPERVLGKTGVQLPILGLGGAGQTPLSSDQESLAIPLIERAIQLGIRYFDTAASYGPSEDYLGKVLPAHRKDIFLASKTSARDRDGAWRELEQSLNRLKTDYLDLWQLHHLSFDAELETILAPNGATKAVEEAKQQKLIRFSGVTGHHEPAVIAAALQRYPFDTTLVSINAADAHHPRPFAPTVLPVAQAKNVGVIAMKVPAYGRLFKPGGLDGMHQAMGYVLSLTGVHNCIIAAESVAQLEQNVSVARAFKPLSKSEIMAISQKVAAVWEENTFFRAWT